MTILRLQHVGIAVKHHQETVLRFETLLGMRARDFRNDQGKGFQHDSRVLLGNDCWLHLVHNWNPESRVGGYLEKIGEGLEHVALESDDVEEDVARLRGLGVPLVEDRVFDANDGFEAFVTPSDAIGFTVELIAPHAKSWRYPDDARGKPLSDRFPISGLRDVVAVVPDVEKARERFEKLFGLSSRGGRILLGDNAGLVLREGGSRMGLERVVLETRGIEREFPHSSEGLSFDITFVSGS